MLLKIGHRGACGYKPENTLASFEEAIRLGVDMIELDVRVSADGQLVVIHDAALERTTNGKGSVRARTWLELREFDAGSGEHIPLLSEVCARVRGRARVNIELKEKGTGTAAASFIREHVAQGWTHDDFLVSSFSRSELLKFIGADHETPVGLLFRSRYFKYSPGRILRGIPFGIFREAKRLRAFSLHIPFSWITGELLFEARAAGVKVFVWTVDDPRDIERMKKMGVDGIFSDYPDRISP